MKNIIHRIIKRIIVKYAGEIKKEISKELYCHGDPSRLHIGKNVSTVNTIFNVASGDIFIGDYTIFGHNCMVLTGRHDFLDGKRKKLQGMNDTPLEGYNIYIGKGCWIASGVIISGGITIGDNVIIGAGSVVTKNIESGKFAAGNPAKIINSL